MSPGRVETDIERYASSLSAAARSRGDDDGAREVRGVRRARFLDVRSSESFARRRLDASSNVHIDDVRGGGAHALPPRTTPFAVIASSASEAEALVNYLRAGDFKAVAWNVEAAFAADDERFFQACRALDLEDEKHGGELYGRVFRVVQGEPEPCERLRLWEPSREFSRWLPRLAADETPSRTCVDFGAGAGRDAVWAASLGWNVLAIDNDARGLARCAALAKAHGVAARVRTVRLDLRKTTSDEAFEEINAVIGRESWSPVSLVYAVRYLQKSLVRDLSRLLPPRAVVCWFHFMRGCESTTVGRPTKDRDLLEHGELREFFLEGEWRTLADEVAFLPDGRPISEFVVVRERT